MEYSQQQQNNHELTLALNLMTRQLDRLEERTRDIVTKVDLETLRKDLVSKDYIEPRFSSLEQQLIRVDQDRKDDREEVEKHFKAVRDDQISRQERLWMRIGQVVAIAAFALSAFSFLAHFKFIP